MMNFQQFQATKTVCADLGVPTSDESMQGVSGLTYLGVLFLMDFTQKPGFYSLLVGREETVSDDLESLERGLYEFACSEGYCDVNVACVKDSDVEAAALVDDLDAALLPLMNIANVSDGGVASMVFSGFDWSAATTDQRVRQLHHWLKTEEV